MNLINNSVGRAIKFVALFSLFTLYIEHIKGGGGGGGEKERDFEERDFEEGYFDYIKEMFHTLVGDHDSCGGYKEHTAGNQQVKEISSFVCGNTITQALRTVSVL